MNLLFFAIFLFFWSGSVWAESPILQVIQLIRSGGLAPTASSAPCLSESQSPAPQHLSCNALAQVYARESTMRDQFHKVKNHVPQDERIRLQVELDGQNFLTQQFAAACVANRFSQCYKNLAPTISKSTLDKMFAAFIKDPHLRYSTGGGACHLRATALAYTLAEAGYAASTVRIEHSPTLIAMDRDRENKLTGRYYDYMGYHTLIQVMVSDGKTIVPYLLDPQFMTQPMPRDEYFLRTTGQVCVEKGKPEALSYLNCNYHLLPQNEPASSPLIPPHILDPKNSYTACGWEKDPLYENFAQMGQKPLDPVAGLEAMNLETPADIKGLAVTEGTSKTLILRAYKNYSVTLIDKLKQAKHSLETNEKYLSAKRVFMYSLEELPIQIAHDKAVIAQLERDLLNLDAKIKEVEGNLRK